MDTIDEIKKRLREIEALLDQMGDTSSEEPVGQDEAGRIGLALDDIYSLYPRKIGKKRGYKKLQKASLDKVYTAVLHYRNYCISQELEPQYIKHFSTWAGEWEDWLEPPMVIHPVKEKRRLEQEQRKRQQQSREVEPQEPALSKDERKKRIADLVDMTTRKLGGS